jgi:hypothetical protein
MQRKRQVEVFQIAREAGAYDEWPLLPADIDPQVHLSRNDRTQPFFLVCEHDSVLTQLSGQALVEFKEAPVLSYTMEPGDFVYVPAGTPHRIVPRTESIQLRYRARDAGLEGAAWYCPACGAEVWREEWDTVEELPQAAYWRVCQAFNGDPDRRRCRDCGAEHPPVDLTGIRWPEVVAAMRREGG